MTKLDGRLSMARLWNNAGDLLRILAVMWLAGMSPLIVIVGMAVGGVLVAFMATLPIAVVIGALWICGIKLEWLGDLITDPWRYAVWTSVVWAPVAALYAQEEFYKRAIRNYEDERAADPR